MNKQHRCILKAFMNAKIPKAIKQYTPELIMIDTVLGGYCSQLLHAKKNISILSDEMITKSEKEHLTELINTLSGESRDELIIYYRLAVLTEMILYQYRKEEKGQSNTNDC